MAEGTTSETNRRYRETVEEAEETFGILPAPLNSIGEEDVVREWPTFETYTVGETEIPPKYRELIGLAVAANIKCPYCAAFHREAAKLHGATAAELEETYVLASFTARYSAMLHAMSYDQERFEHELERIGEHLQGGAETDAAGDD
ncbi:carboxymuconolactone decarboxylase family protein [Natronobiforma cellulositropha]|uniref:carboxymuconolactone decarboxylase family protein n=1 Tax=Natronobiforma cellulositropha TaxID=1679076 RepID=UPI0021D57476|nr:carboxymuconolactone decarboxylase family protein [Natronobiforma cellulositropha]